MGIEELRAALKNVDNKLNMLMDSEKLLQYDSIKISEFIKLIDEFISDEEKSTLLKTEYIRKLSPRVRLDILSTIKNKKLLAEILMNGEVLSGFESYDIIDTMKYLDDEDRIKILRDTKIIEEHALKGWDVAKIIRSIDDRNKKVLLSDSRDVIDEMKLTKDQITDIIKSFKDEATKKEMMDSYDIEYTSYHGEEILKTFSDESKQNIRIDMETNNRYFYENLMSSMSIDGMARFIKENRELIERHDIRIYKCIFSQSVEKQIKIVDRLENMGLSTREKVEILAVLDENVKMRVKTETFSEEYRNAIEASSDAILSSVNVDFNKDMQKYKNLDRLITIKPSEIKEGKIEKIKEICSVCPQATIVDEMNMESTPQEYLNAEKWIASILEKIDKKWTDIQKVAFIDNAVGKKISYCPEFETEVEELNNERALWKIIDSGYGVCNGVEMVERYMLGKAGIECEKARSKRHAFIRLKNIEIPIEGGKTEIGDTLLDPTWNLSSHAYGCRPRNFCVSYEEIREHDREFKGRDTESHRNDEELSDVKLGIDEENLRAVFKSIGLTREDGKFPIADLIANSDIINELKISNSEKIEKQLALISNYNPEFAKCQDSTMKIMSDLIEGGKNIKYDRFVVKRVYEQADKEKKAVLYAYADLGDEGKRFYVADKNVGKFIKLSQQEFENKYECYEKDLENSYGIKPWDKVKTKYDELNLFADEEKEKSVDEGEER